MSLIQSRANLSRCFFVWKMRISKCSSEDSIQTMRVRSWHASGAPKDTQIPFRRSPDPFLFRLDFLLRIIRRPSVEETIHNRPVQEDHPRYKTAEGHRTWSPEDGVLFGRWTPVLGRPQNDRKESKHGSAKVWKQHGTTTVLIFVIVRKILLVFLGI